MEERDCAKSARFDTDSVRQRVYLIGEAALKTLLEIESFLQAREEKIYVQGLAITSPHGSLQNCLEILPCTLTERVGEHLVNLPIGWEDRGVLCIVRFHHSIEPRIST